MKKILFLILFVTMLFSCGRLSGRVLEKEVKTVINEAALDSLAIVGILEEVNRMNNDIYYTYELPMSTEYRKLLTRADNITDSITRTTGAEWDDEWYDLAIPWMEPWADPDTVEYKIVKYESTGNGADKMVEVTVEYNDPQYRGYLSTVTAVFVSEAGNWVIDNVGSHKEILADFIDRNNYAQTQVCEYVDLGLPSGTLWATCNVGAAKPEEFGGYYAWGETEEKEDYSWNTYKWCDGSSTSMTKYCTDSDCGMVDNKTVLDLEDDVAHVKWGGNWRMPTIEEYYELLDKCTWQWTTQGGKNGFKVTSKKNGNSIFLPAEGSGYASFWSSSKHSLKSDAKASSLCCFNSSYQADYIDYRYNGYSVRPVTRSSSLQLSSASSVSSSQKPSKSTINGHEAVDLGLPSGIKWATCNVGAAKPEEFGGYYAWGETEEKEDYSWNTYKWCDGSPTSMTKYCTDSYYGMVDNKTVLDPKDDVAHVKWGGSWRMPTIEELEELLNECYCEWITLNGVNGYRVTGPNGNSIFLPVAGKKYYGRKKIPLDSGSCGFFWSSSLSDGSVLHYAYDLDFDGDRSHEDICERFVGLSVRPVSE